jgi:hypothetical protein
MRSKNCAMLVIAAVAAAGCGSSTKFANEPRPAAPVNVTVFIDNQRVSISPDSVGAGPVDLIVTNQADDAESLAVLPSGTFTGQALADTGPISPQATAQVTVDLNSPGNYTVGIASSDTSQASAATPSTIASALLHVGKARPSSNGTLLEP